MKTTLIAVPADIYWKEKDLNPNFTMLNTPEVVEALIKKWKSVD